MVHLTLSRSISLTRFRAVARVAYLDFASFIHIPYSCILFLRSLIAYLYKETDMLHCLRPIRFFLLIHSMHLKITLVATVTVAPKHRVNSGRPAALRVQRVDKV